MGDPECQVLMMRLKTDLLEIKYLATKDKLNDFEIEWNEDNCMTIVLCANGYPGNHVNNSEIEKLPSADQDNNKQIFHAGTYKKNNKIFSNGGRVLNFVSTSDDFLKCRDETINLIKKLDWKNGYFRRDIGYKVIKI